MLTRETKETWVVEKRRDMSFAVVPSNDPHHAPG